MGETKKSRRDVFARLSAKVLAFPALAVAAGIVFSTAGHKFQ